MAIILRTDFDEISIKGENRNLAYLIYELSFLPSIEKIEEHLKTIEGRRCRIAADLEQKDGVKSVIDTKKILGKLTEIFDEIKNHYRSKADKIRGNEKKLINLHDDHDVHWKYFQYRLRTYAKDIIDREGSDAV